MATTYPVRSNGVPVHPHRVALPYRGDGVAYALCETYAPDHDGVPADMLALLAAIDDRLALIGRD